MIADYVPYFLAFMGIATYVLQLWIGVAFVGWAGDFSFVDRETRPGPFWFVMALQTVLLLLIVYLNLGNG